MLALVRLIIMAIFFIVLTIIAIPICLLRPRNASNTYYVSRILGYFGRKLYHLDLEIRNEENLSQYDSAIYISNHQSNYDIIPFCSVVRPRTVAIGKKELLYVPFFGQLFYLAGNIFIDRKNKKRAWDTLNSAINFIKAKKASVWIMPEGTRSRGRGLGAFKKGPFVMAIQGGLPIVPMVYNSYRSSWDPNRLTGNKVILECLTPIETTGMTDRDVDNLKERVRSQYVETLNRIDSEQSLS